RSLQSDASTPDDSRFITPETTPTSIPTKSATGPPASWAPFSLQSLFDLRKGKRLTKQSMKIGDLPFIGAIDGNNGVRQLISAEAQHPENVITVNYNGTVAEAFYQPGPFWASDDVNVLYPKFKGMDPLVGLFFCTIIRREKYRFNYGRKWNLERMRDSSIRLPVTAKGGPDFNFMRRFVSSLPYSSVAVNGLSG
ncbi:MAG: hypothetical protein G4V63_25730, partial [Candidatus Afipia apatlaquensis]|nr:hypothetical protein [Candidatus Afipia apatlaquensis]